MSNFPKFLAMGLATFTLAACDVEQTQEGQMPEVTTESGQMPEYEQTQEMEMPSVNTEGGQLPRYDVEGPDIDVGMEERTVRTPTIDVNMPGDDEAEVAERQDLREPQAGQEGRQEFSQGQMDRSDSQQLEQDQASRAADEELRQTQVQSAD